MSGTISRGVLARRCLVGLGGLAIAAVVVLRFVLGVGVQPVLSQSMTPTFSAGDVVVTRLVDVEDLRAGDVPAVVPPGQRTPFVHRITDVQRTADGTTVVTRGDGNPTPDPWRATLTTPQVPVVAFTLPAVGHVLAAAGGPLTRAALLALLGLAFTAAAVRQVLGPHPVPAARPSH